MEGKVQDPVYLSPEQVSKLEDLLDNHGDTLRAVFEHIAIEFMQKSRDDILAARNQAAASHAGISKAFETAFDAMAAEAQEQKAQIRLRELEAQEAERLEQEQQGGQIGS